MADPFAIDREEIEREAGPETSSGVDLLWKMTTELGARLDRAEPAHVFTEVVTERIIEQGRTEPLGNWQSFVPTWTASTTNPTNFTATGTYTLMGETCIAHMRFDTSGTTTFGTGTYSFGLPLAAASVTGEAMGPILIEVVGVRRFTGTAVLATSTTVIIYESTNGTPVDSAFGWTAGGDFIDLKVTYEIA